MVRNGETIWPVHPHNFRNDIKWQTYLTANQSNIALNLSMLMPSIFFTCGKNNFSQACFVYLRLSLHNTMMKKQPWIGFPWTSTSLNKVIAKN